MKSIWIIIVATSVVSYLYRASFITLVDGARMPAWARRALPFAPAAILGALLVSMIFFPRTPASVPETLARLSSLALAAAVSWRTGSVLFTIASGMAALWLLRAVTGALIS